MTVLIISITDSGILRMRSELISQLITKGHRVVVVTPPSDAYKGLERLGCEFIPIQIKAHGVNPLQELLLIRKYKELIAGIRPDIVLSYTIKPNIYGGMACAALNIPYIANITGLGTAVENGGILQTLTKAMYHFALRKAKCVFFQNSRNKDFFVNNKLITTRCRVIPGSGVNTEEHRALPYHCGKTVNFLFVARILKEKGIALYLNAARVIHEKYENTMFHICGGYDDVSYKSAIAEAENEGYVKYHGQQNNMIPFYDMANCVVHPSYYPEGMSNVLLEAAAHARPVITTDRAGCREAVDDGKSGYIVPIKNEAVLIEAIDKFINLPEDEQRAMGLNGRAKMEKEFDRQIVIDAYIEEINSIKDERK